MDLLGLLRFPVAVLSLADRRLYLVLWGRDDQPCAIASRADHALYCQPSPVLDEPKGVSRPRRARRARQRRGTAAQPGCARRSTPASGPSYVRQSASEPKALPLICCEATQLVGHRFRRTRLPNSPQQFVGVDWFADERVVVSKSCAKPSFRNRSVNCEPHILARDGSCQLDAIHTRHRDVQDSHVKFGARHQVQRVSSVGLQS